MTKKIIAVQPLGDVSPDVLGVVVENLQAVYHIEAELLPERAVPVEAYDPHRRQHNCYPILKYLNELMPEHAVKIVGLTEVDLFIPILTHVFGEAELRGNATVISTFRLIRGPDKEDLPLIRVLERVTKIAVHELAHTLGLAHCREDGCIMGNVPTLSKIDQNAVHFCRYCLVFLRDEYERLGLDWAEDTGVCPRSTP